jgi:hypothetical protein
MGSVWSKFKKLRGRGRDELRVRGAQAASAFAERRGWSEQSRVPADAAFFKLLDPTQCAAPTLSAAGLLEHFRARESRFFAAFSDPEETRAELSRRRPAWAEEDLLGRAEKIVAGRFDLLGFRDLNFGDPVDWHLEPVSGKRVPRIHWSRIDFLDSEVAGDKKVLWELNRQQYFMVLGRAYWLTGDERYARVFVAHLESWMEENPPKLGINWASSLEVSYRAIAWLWALHFFRDSEQLRPQTFLRALKFLYLHARHLETYLSTYFSPNTHLTGEALGLFYIGTAFPEFRAAARWRDTGRRVLVGELHRQVRPDGVYYEQATYYQRYTADIYTHFYALTLARGEEVEGLLREKLCAMLDFLMHLMRPDGTTPFFGDDDGGRLAWLDERPANDFRSTLATGAALFSRPDYKFAAGAHADEEALWLLGSAGLARFDELEARPPADASRAFTEGGFYVMRDGWATDANYLLIDCGPHGALNCGHAHADALSFDLSARGRTRLVDPGTYTYTGSGDLRDWFRSSAAHNTLTVDGQSSSLPGRTFQWRHIAECVTRKWASNARFDYFEGAHDGYARLASPATHVRGILFLKDGYWIMRDIIETHGAHSYVAHFHFAAGVEPVVEREGEMFVVREGRADAASGGLEIFAPASDGVWKKETGWVSERYGERAEAHVCTRTLKAEGRREFITFLVPQAARQGDSRTRVFEISAVGGRAFIHDRIAPSAGGDGARLQGVRDLLLVGDGRHKVSTTNFVSDFAWTWARFAGERSEPDELVLIDGRQLAINGEKIVWARGTGRIGHLHARRVDEVWQVETDAEVEFPAAERGAEPASAFGG